MKHMAFGKFAILGAFVVAGCYSYPSENINNSNFNTVQADPSFSHVIVGDSDQMLVRLVNDANNGTVTSFVVNNANSGITVHYNANYRPYQDANTDTLANVTDKSQQEYYIVGNVPGTYTFTLTPTSVNTGVSATVTVVVLPHDLGTALSVHSAASGAPVTVTAPPGTVFSDTSAVTIPGAAIGIISRAPDGSSITFAAVSTTPGGSDTPVTVNNVGVASSPTTQYSTLVTDDSLALAAVPSPLPTTVSATSVGAGQSFTVTLSNTVRFLGNSVVTIGGTTAGITSISADSSTATILPNPYSSGTLAFANVALSAVTGVPISLNSNQSITVGAAYAGGFDPNASSPATASTFKLIGSTTFALADSGRPGPCVAAIANSNIGGDVCLYYKVTLAAGTVTGNILWDTPHSNDMALALTSADGSTCIATIADTQGQVPGNVGDESSATSTCSDNGTATTIPAGTYLLVVVNEGYTGAPFPAWIEFLFSQP